MKTKLIAAVAFAGASTMAFAQQGGTADIGPYAGISGGRSTTAFTSQDFSVNSYNTRYAASRGKIADTTDTRNTAWRLFLGYRFDQNWAVEGGYTSLGEGKYTMTGLAAAGAYARGTSAQYRVENNAWSLAVKGILPVSKEFDLFGLVGGSWNESKTSLGASGTFATNLGASANASKTRGYAMFGLGVEYKPTANIGIRGEYHNYGKFGSNIVDATDNTGRTEMDAWLLGVSFKF